MNAAEKLMQVQSRLKAPKSQRNTFGNYNYRNCEDILEALKPLLLEVKAIVTLSDKIQLIGDRFYIQADASFTDIETNEIITVSAMAREDENKKGMDLAQITGSVSSYARKYALNGLFCIDDTKDSDATNEHDKAPKNDFKAPTKEDTDKTTTQMLIDIAAAKGFNEASICKKYGAKEVKFIKQEDKKAAYENFKKLPDKI